MTLQEARDTVKLIREVAGAGGLEEAHVHEDDLRQGILEEILRLTLTLDTSKSYDIAIDLITQIYELAEIALSTSEIDFERLYSE